MKFISTVNKRNAVSGAEAIVRGIAPDGGLYVPETFPRISAADLASMLDMDYPERAAFIIGKFLPELKSLGEMTEKAYARFDGDPAPVLQIDDGYYYLELWHGPTHAFKDIALTLLPYLLSASKKAVGDDSETVVLVATSGDTGKAALEGFKDVDGTGVTVFYPSDGVSPMQKLQMMTQEGGNVHVAAIRGNFDDAQTAVKAAFTDKTLIDALQKSGKAFSSANSINFGRLVPQIVYYFSAYLDILDAGRVQEGGKVNFVVPTGNFGNILAGYYAMRMGLPVGKLICASNRNNVLTEFFREGQYDARREFFKTQSPSMDILVSSNLERLLFEIAGRDDGLTAKRMAELKGNGAYTITDSERAALNELFWAGYADEDATAAAIADVFDEYEYVVDPHTAVAAAVYEQYKEETGDETPTVIVSTASPFKFPKSVLTALGERVPDDDFKAVYRLEDVSAMPAPESIVALERMEKRFADIIDKQDIGDYVRTLYGKKD
ncbi:MAG: threonine synthase [Clostridia bacterium]|jgi:threonine synthase|nr:threonine synthase [Clostridia bacterium]